MTAWARLARETMEGKVYGEPPPEVDFPPVNDAGEGAWTNALSALDREEMALIAAVREFPDGRLNERPDGKDFSFYVLLHGLAQHNIYHAGQIAILKRG